MTGIFLDGVEIGRVVVVRTLHAFRAALPLGNQVLLVRMRERVQSDEVAARRKLEVLRGQVNPIDEAAVQSARDEYSIARCKLRILEHALNQKPSERTPFGHGECI